MDKLDALGIFCLGTILTIGLGIGIIFFQLRDIRKQERKPQLENLGIVDCYFYTNVKSMTDQSPNVMANNSEVFEGAIAVSRDLLDQLQFNDRVKLEINGQETKFFIVQDLMAKKMKRSIDIFLPNTKENKKIFNRRYRGRLFLVK